MDYKCVGCDRIIPWDGEGTFSYTCACGCRIFYDEKLGGVAVPTSLPISLIMNIQPPHLDGLIGNSNHTSLIKEGLIIALKERGCIWMSDCELCRSDGTLKWHQDREAHLAVLEAERIVQQDGG